MGFQEALALHVSLLHWHAPALYLKHVLFEGLNCSHGETTYRLSYKFAWDDCSVCQWRSFQHLPFYFNPPLDCLLLASYTTSTFISKNRTFASVQAHCKYFPAATLNSTIFSNLPCQPNIIIISSFYFGNFQIIPLPYLLIIIHYSAHYTFAQSLLVHSFSCYPLLSQIFPIFKRCFHYDLIMSSFQIACRCWMLYDFFNSGYIQVQLKLTSSKWYTNI